MDIFTTVDQLHKFLEFERSKKNTIAFVPTLGALHSGHLSLMAHARDIANVSVASIFVNPTQFNDAQDLAKYPRPLRSDIHQLAISGVDILFLPLDDEVYPPGKNLSVPVNLDHLLSVLEGPNRPGHFQGVITVVKRLLDIVQPDFLIMGQKDYQQQAIIGEMIRQLKIPTALILHPTQRDVDGLALSSRNVRIIPALRPVANTLYIALQEAKRLYRKHSPEEIMSICAKMIIDKGFRLEYFSLVDGLSLQPIRDWSSSTPVVACVAAWLGEVRLIDNEILN